MTNNPLIDIGGLAQPATTLIEKISDAIGGVAKPRQIREIAKAEAEAREIHAISQAKVDMIKAKSEAEIEVLKLHASLRIMKEQGNCSGLLQQQSGL